jgi:hypothetical protein
MRTPLSVAASLALVVVLGGCAGSSRPQAPAAPKAAVAAHSAPVNAYVTWAAYRADPAAFAHRKIVLFFYSSLCADSHDSDARLRRALTDGTWPSAVSVVQVDYDRATQVRAKYRALGENTFQQIDPNGRALDVPISGWSDVSALFGALV